MTQSDIQAVLNREPTLTEFGMSDPRGEKFEAERRYLLKRAELCTRVCEWLETLRTNKTISGRVTSYAIKHEAERSIGEYVTNGELIVAAIHCGVDYQKIPGSPNVRLAISVKSFPSPTV